MYVFGFSFLIFFLVGCECDERCESVKFKV